jgi:hypothetical protein
MRLGGVPVQDDLSLVLPVNVPDLLTGLALEPLEPGA